MARKSLNIRSKSPLPRQNFVMNVTNRDKDKWYISPTNSVPASISGTGIVGAVTTAVPGVWEGAVTVTAEWWVGGVATGDTDSTYTVLFADIGKAILYKETATNPYGTTEQDSNSITAIAA